MRRQDDDDSLCMTGAGHREETRTRPNSARPRLLTKKYLRGGGGLGLRQNSDVDAVLLEPHEVMYQLRSGKTSGVGADQGATGVGGPLVHLVPPPGSAVRQRLEEVGRLRDPRDSVGGGSWEGAGGKTS